jgi:hypothetical protein
MKGRQRRIGIILCLLFALGGAGVLGFYGLMTMGFEGDSSSGPKLGVLWPLGGLLLGSLPGIVLLWLVLRSPAE